MGRLRTASLLGLAACWAQACTSFDGADSVLPGSGGGGAGAFGAGGAPAGSPSSGAGSSGNASAGAATGGLGGAAASCLLGGAPDCSNPTCSDFECVPAPPQGWSTPGAYYGGPAGSPLAACTGLWPVAGAHGRTGLDAPPASCSACSCQTQCGPTTTVDYYSDPACANFASSTDFPTSGTCTSDIEQHYVKGGGPIAGSACTSAGGVAVTQPPAWSSAARVCLPPSAGGGCAGAGLCVPKPVAPFALTACTFHPGAVACPPGYGQRFVLYASSNDTRGCAPCGCTFECTATVDFFGSDGCANLFGTSSGACFATMPTIESLSATVTTATCQSTGGTPTGAVTGADATTVCCQ